MSRVVVTGASSGIGRAVALLLSKDGHALVLTSRQEDKLRSLADACLAGGAASVSVVAGDISDPDTAPQLADAVRESGSGEVVLINNAGVAKFGPFHSMGIDDSVAMVRVMLEGTMRATHALLPMMLEQGKGTVVNVLSIAVMNDFAGSEAYSAAKYGQHGFAKSLSKSYRRQGIRVTNVIPGSTDTHLWDAVESPPAREDMLTAEAIAQTIKMVIDSPRDRSFDEIVVTPPKGVL
jgi:short-subunit dehydrogenase